MNTLQFFQVALITLALTTGCAHATDQSRSAEIERMFHAEKRSLSEYREAIVRADSFAGEMSNQASDVESVVTVLKAMHTLHHEYRNPSSIPVIAAGERGILQSPVDLLSRRIRDLEDETRKFEVRSRTWGTRDEMYGNRLADYLARVRATHDRAQRTEQLRAELLRASDHGTAE